MDAIITVYAIDKIHGLEFSDKVHIKSDEQNVGVFLPFMFEVDFPIEELRKVLAKIDAESKGDST